DFLGTGVTLTRIYAIGAAEFGRISPYVNLGYVVSSGSSDVTGDVPDEFDYLAGVNWSFHPRWTISADFLGRMLRSADRVAVVDNVYHYRTTDGGPLFRSTQPSLDTYSGDVNSMSGAVGIKYNPTGTMIISASGLFPLSDEGLRNNTGFSVGLDWTF